MFFLPISHLRAAWACGLTNRFQASDKHAICQSDKSRTIVVSNSISRAVCFLVSWIEELLLIMVVSQQQGDGTG